MGSMWEDWTTLMTMRNGGIGMYTTNMTNVTLHPTYDQGINTALHVTQVNSFAIMKYPPFTQDP